MGNRISKTGVYDLKDIEQLFNRLNYKPLNQSLFTEAITHSSANEKFSYERIEFLGDSVLQLISSEKFYRSMPTASEGVLSKTRAAHVSEKPLSCWAKHIGLGDYILFGKSELANGGPKKDSILADVVEAIIGAVYLDRGLPAARELIESIFNYAESCGLTRDFKTDFQEYIQQTGEHDIKYEVLKTEGPPHSPIFFVRLSVDDKDISQGKGKSKKDAEQQAARTAMENMKII